MQAAELLHKAQKSYEALNDRERKLLMLMGGIFLALVLFLPLFLVGSAVGEAEERNEQIQAVLRDIRRAGPTLETRRAERELALSRYRQKAPPLGSFLEQKAREQSLTLREVNDSPEVAIGDYTRRQVRVTLPQVQLLPVVKMLTSIENSRLPVTIDRIHVEHFREGQDNYNVQLGVSAYDRNTPLPDSAEDGEGPAPAASPRVRRRLGAQGGR